MLKFQQESKAQYPQNNSDLSQAEPEPLAEEKGVLVRSSASLTDTLSQTIHYSLGFFKQQLLPRLIPTMTEIRFPKAAFLQGDIFWGQAWRVLDADGLGADRIISEAAGLAYKNDLKLCQWRFGPQKFVLLMLKPAHIAELLVKHKDNFYHHDSSKSFVEFFGEGTIFSLEYGSEQWKTIRHKFLNTLMAENALSQAVKPMQEVISRFSMKIASAENRVFNFSNEANCLALDMIGIKLGLYEVPDSTKLKIVQLINRGAIAVSSHRSQTLKKYLPIVKYPPVSWCYQSTIEAIMQEGIRLIRTDILPANKAFILKNKNWLNPEGTLTEAELYSQKTAQRIMEFYVAGSETSATLLLFTLLLLADPQHKSVLDTLRQEILAQKKTPEEWTYADLQKLHYFKLVINESLRLYPPIPDILFEFFNPTPTAAGVLKKGDLAIISPRFIHRLRSEWGEDADKFRPERFDEDSYRNHPFKSFLFCPFGFQPRSCPGQENAKQGTILILARLLHHFDISIENTDLKHPFKTHQIFTLHAEEENIALRFTPRSMQLVAQEEDESEHKLNV